jgi:thiamine-monophosphate kinase
VLAHAGVLGHSAAGLALLSAGVVTGEVPAALDPFVAGYLRPAPPLALGITANDAGASAMLDVSDGLLRDAGRIAAASGVALDLSSAALEPAVAALRPAAAVLGDHAAALRWVRSGGEDHGLLATFPPGAALPEGFRSIGSVTVGAGVTIDSQVSGADVGWDHFRA